MGDAVTEGDERGRRSEAGTPDWEEDAPSLSDDGMFEVLANRRRRQVLQHLREGDGTATVGDLAERIAATENDTTVQNLSSYDRKRVYVSLYQNHLPVMDEANVVEYAEHRKTVELLDTATKIEPYLDDAPESAGRRPSVAVALLTAALVLLGSLQIGTFGVVPVAGWTLFGVVGLVGVAWTALRHTATE